MWGVRLPLLESGINNRNSSMNRYGKGQRGIAGEHLYAHFFEEGHRGIENILVTIVLLIRRTLMNQHKERDFGRIS